MTIYYQDELVTLHHGSCVPAPDVEFVDAWLAADVMVTDPPYGMAYQSNSSKAGPSAAIEGDGDTRIRDEALRMWGAERGAIAFGTWRVDRPDRTIGREIRQLVIWDKGDSPGMGDLTLPWGPTHEDIYVMGSTGIIRPGGGSSAARR